MIEATHESDYTEGRELIILRQDPDARSIVSPGHKSIRDAYYHFIKMIGANIPLPF